MPSNLIRKVISIDKEARQEIEDLKQEKDKDRINEYLKEEKKKFIERYTLEVNEQISSTKKKIDADIENKKKEASKQFEEIIESIEEKFNKNKDHWIDLIYKFCIEDTKGDING